MPSKAKTLWLPLCLLIGFAAVAMASEILRTLKITESAMPGTIIGFISETNGSSSMSLDTPAYVVIFSSDGQAEKDISVNEYTGQIKTIEPLDHERKAQYIFIAIPTENSVSGIRVVIEVLDENDNSPIFPMATVDVELSENVRINSEMPLPSAIDRDSGQFGIQKYEILSGNTNNAFRLSSRRVGSQLYVDLVVNGNLDRELKDQYMLEIKASDGGTPPRTGSMNVHVILHDRNDHTPQFESSRYSAQIDENATAGVEILRVHASDKDIGVNGDVDYAILPSPQDAQRKFTIDAKEGTIRLASPLSSGDQRRNIYELVVVARDKGAQPLESTAIVRIHVVSSTSSRPQIKILYLSDDSSSTIPESAKIGSIIARISVSDADGREEFGSFNWKISDRTARQTLECRTTEQSVCLLTLIKALDRESVAKYNFVIAASNASNPLHDSPDISSPVIQKNVSLTVLDVNDNRPQFAQQTYEADVNEKAIPGTSVLQVTATDADEGENARLSYSLQAAWPQYANWFKIDSESGLITVMQKIDCGLSSRPEFTIEARDHGSPNSLATSTKLIINVLDINQSPPRFEHTIYNISLLEDISIGTCFLKLTAVDPDCGANAQVRYGIVVDVAVEKGLFQVNENAGNLCTNSSLDFEARQMYLFYVVAYDAAGLSSTALVQVFVQDSNDNPPVFYPTDYKASLEIASLRSTDEPVLFVSASDKDNGRFGEVIYKIESGDARDLFRVNATTGQIFMKRLPNTGDSGSYQLAIEAVDGGGAMALNRASVTILFLHQADQSPMAFDAFVYTVRTREDTLPGITVGQVKAKGSMPATYRIYDGNRDGQFEVEPNSGKVSLLQYLDHEKQSTILLNIEAAAGNPASVLSYTQINDNDPRFDYTAIHISVPEDQDPHVPIFVVKANDKDSNQNGFVKYRLVSNPGNTFIVSPYSGEVLLNRFLDYEAYRNYTIEITASDGGIPTRTANVTIYVEVLDKNDNAPQFSERSGRITVSEDMPVLSKLLLLHARDADSGANGQLIYSLANQNETSEFGIFSDSGWLYVRKPLDRERQADYHLQVLATDLGLPPLTGSTEIFVNISDVNDSPPACPRVAEFSVDENNPAGISIGQLKATDPDVGENATLHYTIMPDEQSASSAIKIDPFTGELFAGISFDHEANPEYAFAVIVNDLGTPALSSSCSVLLRINDLNDNPPFFVLPYQNRIFVKEEQPAGSEVTQVRATDPDSGPNGLIRYGFTNQDNILPFKIDPNTGVIQITQRLDYETSPHTYELNIFAQDKGTPPRSVQKSLVIELLDIGDSDDAIAVGSRSVSGQANAATSFELPELTPVGTKIGLAEPKSPTQSPSIDQTDIVYEIMSGNSLGLFDIDKVTSALYLAKPLDYETAPIHLLQVSRVNVSSAFPVSGIIVVKILVIDQNDNFPTFPEDPVIFSVAENVRRGLILWTYNASDLDAGSNGRIQYRLEEQLPEPAFDIDPVTGELWPIVILDHERVTDYLVVVSATDQAVEPTERKSSRVTSRIYIIDQNDNAPAFASRDQVYVFEDEPIGYPIVHILATDADWKENGNVSYRIMAGNEAGMFELNNATGALVLTKRLDHESVKQYKLTIRAKDHGVVPLSSNQLLRITIQDVNDNAPRFSSSIYRGNVSENAASGSFVVQLFATDRDGNGHRELIYVLPAGLTAYSKFRLNEKTGVLETAAALDREQQSEYIITVYVRDSAVPRNYDAATVIVSVEDQNDNSPKLVESTCHSVAISENQAFQNFQTALARDRDAGQNGRVAYSITAGNVDGKFRIDPDTGELSVASLDRESTGFYNLSLSARDNGIPQLQDKCILMVTVLDTNDNPPAFEQLGYATDVPENLKRGRKILTVKATDPDEQENAQIVYSLTNESAGIFEINPSTGAISLIGNLDYETRPTMSFAVVASDQGTLQSLSAIAQIKLRILDANDNAPVFSSLPFLVNIERDIAAGQRITKVTAVDADSPGINSEVWYSLKDVQQSEFSINPGTGVISSKADLHLQPGAMQLLQVLATDKGDPSLSSTGIVQIIVRSSAKEQTTPRIRFAIEQMKLLLRQGSANVKTGSELIQCRLLSISDNTTLKTNGGIAEFQIISGNQDAIFRLDKWSGTIFLADEAKLNFEQTSTLRLVISARLPQTSVTGKATLRGDDIKFDYAFASLDVRLVASDQKPQFLQQQYFSAIMEGRPQGSLVIQVSALDSDYGEDSHLTYSIVNGNLDNAFNIDGAGAIRTKVELDREINDHYKLTVMATTSEVSSSSATATVHVQILDQNDNTPQFAPTRLVKIAEDAPLGTLVATITANDVDTAPPLNYRFTASGNPGSVFAIETFSGRLILMQRLDYESQKEYLITIEASDGIHLAVSKQKVQVVDVNDETPTFTQQFYQVSLPENTPGGTSIMHVSATDKDSGKNGQVTYRLVESAQTVVGFELNRDTGELFITGEMRQHEPRHSMDGLTELVVEAKDKGRPPRSSLASIQIQFVPKSVELQPKFSKDFYKFSISEDSVPQTVVGNIAAAAVQSTAGSDVNLQHLIYEVKSSSENQPVVRIDRLGNVILTKALDRETQDTFQFDVVVFTKANSVANSTTRLLILVLDCNDNQPVFDSNEYSVSVLETVPIGRQIIKLTASDADNGENGTITYEITSGNENEEFAIDNATGLVTLSKHLEFEQKNLYKLIVRASDNAKVNRKSTITALLINVQNENTYPPQFYVSQLIDQIAENEPVGTLIFTAKAYDKDKNDRIFYAINSAEDNDDSVKQPNSSFSINATSGEVRSAAVFDYETKTSFKFRISATDTSGKTASVPVTVIIRGVDEYSPVFTEETYAFQAYYESAIGEIVNVIIASDADAGIDGQVVYGFKEEQPLFAVHPTTGTLSVKGDLRSLDNDQNPGFADPRKSTTAAPLVLPNLAKLQTPQVSSVESSVAKPIGKKMSISVFARSSSDIAFARATTAIVEISLSHSQKSTAYSGITARTISILSTILIILLLLVITFIALRLRREKKHSLKEAAVNSASQRKAFSAIGCLRHQQSKKWRTEKDASLPQDPRRSIKADNKTNKCTPVDNGRGYPQQPNGTSALCGRLRKSVNATTPTAIAGRRPAPSFASFAQSKANGRTRQLNSVSGRSSGHGSTIGEDADVIDESDEEMQRLNAMYGTSDRTCNIRSSMPDSGIHLFPTEDVISTSSDVQNAQEYLSNLGISTTVFDDRTSRPGRSGANSSVSQSNTFPCNDGYSNANDMDINSLIYARLADVAIEDVLSSDCSKSFQPYKRKTSADSNITNGRHGRMRSSLADDAVFNAPIIIEPNNLSSCTSWLDSCKDWGPSFQPLTELLNEEIAQLHQRSAAQQPLHRTTLLTGPAVPNDLSVTSFGHQSTMNRTQQHFDFDGPCVSETSRAQTGSVRPTLQEQPFERSKTSIVYTKLPTPNKLPIMNGAKPATQSQVHGILQERSPELTLMPDFASPSSPSITPYNRPLENGMPSEKVAPEMYYQAVVLEPTEDDVEIKI